MVGKKKEDLQRCLGVWMPGERRDVMAWKYKKKKAVGIRPTFDLEVDHPDHLFVTADGLIVSNSVPKSGYLGKQMVAAAHRLVVTEKDCGTTNGIPVAGNDPDNEGAVLARAYGGIEAGTVLSPGQLGKFGDKPVFVRSPITCQAKQGICSRCAGMRETGSFPAVGSNLGVAAAQAIIEPLTQSTLGTKHGGGQAKGKQPAKSGLDAVNQLIQIPQVFQGGAAVALSDGRVTSVSDAPQGGKLVLIDGKEHWVPPDRTLTIAKGDVVEAGDSLSDGIPNPALVAEHKGIGEGRRSFMETMHKTLTEAGSPAHRRNVELLARGLVNHVRITDLDGPADTMADDVAEYDAISRDYQPRYGFKSMVPKQAVGLHLEEPVLHYSIGTRVTPRSAGMMAQHGVAAVKVHPDAPSFVPEMTRAVETLGHSDDWMVRMGGLHGIKKNTLEAVHRGLSSGEHGTSYIPSLAKGIEFGKPPTGEAY
jgi:hypothetical protein